MNECLNDISVYLGSYSFSFQIFNAARQLSHIEAAHGGRGGGGVRCGGLGGILHFILI